MLCSWSRKEKGGILFPGASSSCAIGLRSKSGPSARSTVFTVLSASPPPLQGSPGLQAGLQGAAGADCPPGAVGAGRRAGEGLPQLLPLLPGAGTRGLTKGMLHFVFPGPAASVHSGCSSISEDLVVAQVGGPARRKELFAAPSWALSLARVQRSCASCSREPRPQRCCWEELWLTRPELHFTRAWPSCLPPGFVLQLCSPLRAPSWWTSRGQ